MADTKLSDLTALTGANVAIATDKMYIVDTSDGATGSKYIVPEELFKAIAAITASGTVSAHAFTNPNPGTAAGTSNEAFGATAGAALAAGGNYNCAVGAGALKACTTGDNNTAMGYNAGTTQITVGNSTFVGFKAGEVATGAGNTCLGASAGTSITTGTNNIAIGYSSGAATTGSANIGIGSNTLAYNVSGNSNVVIGSDAGIGTGAGNGSFGSCLLIGGSAGKVLSSGATGVAAIGFEALKAATTGNNNIAIGYKCADNLVDGASNIFIGASIDASAVNVNYELNIGGLIVGSMAAGANKIGFMGATPVARAAHIADADGAAIAKILVVLENLGFIATS